MHAYEHRTPDVTLAKFKHREGQTYSNRQLKCSRTLSILQYLAIIRIHKIQIINKWLLLTEGHLLQLQWGNWNREPSVLISNSLNSRFSINSKIEIVTSIHPSQCLNDLSLKICRFYYGYPRHSHGVDFHSSWYQCSWCPGQSACGPRRWDIMSTETQRPHMNIVSLMMHVLANPPACIRKIF